jgi:PhnB protein
MKPVAPSEFIIPMLVCKDASSEIDFCKAAFGAVELSRRSAKDGSVLHAALKIGAAMIMVHGETSNLASRAPNADGSSSVVLYLYLQDMDAAIARAIGSGARLLIPATNSSWGDRVGRVIDMEGHVWNVATRFHEKEA